MTAVRGDVSSGSLVAYAGGFRCGRTWNRLTASTLGRLFGWLRPSKRPTDRRPTTGDGAEAKVTAGLA